MGTFDVSILEFGSGVFEVLSTNGDTHLGGDDVDNVLIQYLADEFKSDTGVDLTKDPMAMQRLKEAAEKAKIELSSSLSTEVNLPYITVLDGVPQHLVKSITRAKFEQLIDGIVRRTIEPCKKALEDAKVTPNDIDEILLVGGSTRIPAIQEAVKNFFGKEPSKAVNPDEAVAMGAAIQGAILNNEEGVGDVVLLDVTPISMGIEAHNQFDPKGRLAKIIEGNTTIPCKKSQTFTTAVDNQDAVDIVILQGERTYADDCKRIGTFRLDGITPAKAGVPQIEVSFDIDANGVLNVTAKDKATGKEQSITIKKENSLSDAEIEQMKADAEAHKEEDAKREEEMAKLNSHQMLVNSIEAVLENEEMKDKITDEERENITGLKNTLSEKIKSYAAAEDKAVAMQEIEDANKALSDVWSPIIQKIYAEANPQGAAQGNPFDAAGPNNPFAGFNFADATHATNTQA